jgi:glutathione S-transferase
MIELFQITGSASFATRAALEELGAEYTTIDVHPRRRDETPDFVAVNPLQRVPAIRDGETNVYETGAVLIYLGDRFPDARLAPPIGDRHRGRYLRWIAYLANTLHQIWFPYQYPGIFAEDPIAHPAVKAAARKRIEAAGAYLESELEGRDWCLGERFSLADIYLYQCTGWQHYNDDGLRLGGPNVQAHLARVGARAAIARTRALDDLRPDFQRNHPELRAGKPV